MRDVLRIARSRDEFLALIADALEERDPEAARRRQQSVAGGTWDARAEWVSEIIEKALAAKEKPSLV
jgi:acyl-CoA reductase-like NAD-dependent aldehyde dehydrogenase